MTILKRPTILIFDAPVAPGAPEHETLLAAGIEANLLEWRAMDSFAREEALSKADFILTWKTDADESLLGRASSCLLVLHYGPGIGPDVARVAMETARRSGIYVSSVPDYAPQEWARVSFQLIQSLRQARTGWANRDLQGLRLGVVGFGSVGRIVARQGIELGMEVWGCDPFVGEAWFEQEGVRRAELMTLMGISDIVTLHVPLGPATRRMISAEPLALMRDQSILIDSAEPELVDLDALALALERGKPAAAGFDEDLARLLPPGHSLLGQALQNIKLWHGSRQAGRNEETSSAVRRQAVAMIVHVLQGNRPSHLLIDPPCPRHILLMAGQAWD